jgi:hypothetical protein
MTTPRRKPSRTTVVIGGARLIVGLFGIALILALFLCFAAELLDLDNAAVGKIFPQIVVLLVYDAAAMVLLRVALGLSVRRDRAS